MPVAVENAFVERSQPESSGIRSWRRYNVVRFQRNGTDASERSWPTTQSNAFTAVAVPRVVPWSKGIASVPVSYLHINGRSFTPLEPTTNALPPTPNALAV